MVFKICERLFRLIFFSSDIDFLLDLCLYDAPSASRIVTMAHVKFYDARVVPNIYYRGFMVVYETLFFK